jgi:hypothetical protein
MCGYANMQMQICGFSRKVRKLEGREDVKKWTGGIPIACGDTGNNIVVFEDTDNGSKM